MYSGDVGDEVDTRAPTCHGGLGGGAWGKSLGSNVNTPLPSNKISCVRQEHTLDSN